MNVSSLKPAGAPAAPAAPRPKVLAGLTAKKLVTPSRTLLYGVEGIGKSTFASQAPKPIFLGSEDGTSQLEVYRYPKPLQRARDIFEALDVLEHEEHDFETVVLDTVDWAEPLIWAEVCADAGKRSIEDFGFGKGYVAAQDEWRRLLARFDAIRAKRRMHVVLLGHSTVRSFANPEGDNFDRYQLKMHEKSAGILREWVDCVLFANYETFAVKAGDASKKAKGVSSGSRVVHTERRAAFDAKNRYALPEKLPLDWAEYWAAIQAHRPQEPGALREQIEAMLGEIADDDLAEKVRAAVTGAGDDAVKLAAFANKVSVRLQEKRDKQ